MWEYELVQDIKDPEVEEDSINESNRGAEQEKHHNDVEERSPGLLLTAKGLRRSNGKRKTSLGCLFVFFFSLQSSDVLRFCVSADRAED